MNGVQAKNSKEKFVSAHHLGTLHSLVEGVWNHISYDDPLSPDTVLITPGHVHWDLVKIDNVVVFDKKTESYVSRYNFYYVPPIENLIQKK